MRIIISSCLLGHKTRYDGKSKPVELPAELADAEIIHFCPEVAAGFGVPREPMELVGDRAIRIRDRADMTPQLAAACEAFLAQLQTPPDLFILKSRSPSCGASGIWTAKIREKFPDTPVKDEAGIRLPQD